MTAAQLRCSGGWPAGSGMFRRVPAWPRSRRALQGGSTAGPRPGWTGERSRNEPQAVRAVGASISPRYRGCRGVRPAMDR